MPPLSIRVEDAAGAAQGDGPIVSAASWSYTERLGQAGDIAFTMPAVDTRAALLTDPDSLHYITAQAKVGTVGRSTVGAGIVKNLSLNSEARMLQVSGPDLAGELLHTSPKRLFLHGAGEDDPMAAADVFPALMADSLGWVVVDVNGDPAVLSKDLEPYQLGDETHLAAINKIADLTGDKWRKITDDEQFTLGLGPRHIIWLPTTPSGFDAAASGIRAIDQGESSALLDNAEVCLIDGGLEVINDLTKRCTRILPRGGGNADATLYLNQTTRFGHTPNVAGNVTVGDYTLHVDADGSKSYISYNPAEPTSADVLEAVESFGDIAPIKRTNAAEIAAANMLFDAALVRLNERIVAQTAYRLRVTKLHRPVKMGETIHVICRHWTSGYGWIQVNQPLMMLSKTESREAPGGDAVVTLEVTE